MFTQFPAGNVEEVADAEVSSLLFSGPNSDIIIFTQRYRCFQITNCTTFIFQFRNYLNYVIDNKLDRQCVLVMLGKSFLTL